MAKNIGYKLYDKPNEIFVDNEHKDMTGINNIDLASAFYRVRFNGKGELCNSDLGRNAGAVQLFHNKNNTVSCTNAYGAISQSVHTYYPAEEQVRKLSSFGHTEKNLMTRVLDEFITEEGDNSGGASNAFLSPSQRSRSGDKRDKPSEIPRALVNDAKGYEQLNKKGSCC